MDSLGPRMVGRLPFDIIRSHSARSLVVGDAAVREAQRIVWEQLHLGAEAGAVVALAAVLTQSFQAAPEEVIGIVLTGGNVSSSVLAA